MTDSQEPARRSERTQISAESLRKLTAALPGFTGADPSRDGMRSALVDICKEAKSKGMRAEQLLVAFKSSLEEVPEIRDAATPAAREDLVRRLVTMCITEYYK